MITPLSSIRHHLYRRPMRCQCNIITNDNDEFDQGHDYRLMCIQQKKAPCKHATPGLSHLTGDCTVSR